MGVGLVEPIDDFRDEHPCVNERAMEYLGKELVRSGFNLKDLTRIILYSQTYQRAASDYDMTSGETVLFSRADDSTHDGRTGLGFDVDLAGAKSDAVPAPDAKEMAPYLDVDFETLTFEEAKAAV